MTRHRQTLQLICVYPTILYESLKIRPQHLDHKAKILQPFSSKGLGWVLMSE